MSVFERVILGLQTALVFSLLTNAFLAALLAVVVRELRKEMAKHGSRP